MKSTANYILIQSNDLKLIKRLFLGSRIKDELEELLVLLEVNIFKR